MQPSFTVVSSPVTLNTVVTETITEEFKITFRYNELSQKIRFQSQIAALCLYNIQRENLGFKKSLSTYSLLHFSLPLLFVHLQKTARKYKTTVWFLLVICKCKWSNRLTKGKYPNISYKNAYRHPNTIF